MILLDYSHLMHRLLHVAIGLTKPKEINGILDTNTFKPMMLHMMLNNIKAIKNKFSQFGDIVVCLDSKNYWRRDIYPEYKASRKKSRDESNIDYNAVFKAVDELTQNLISCFPYKVIQVDKCEADDIIAVLTMNYSLLEDVIIISSDKDFKQLLKYPNTTLYNPITNEKVKMSADEINQYEIFHTLNGDDSDNIPNIKAGSIFSKNFKSFLVSKGIDLEDVYEFNKLSISKQLYAEFNTPVLNKKGEDTGKIDYFHTVPFGEVGIKKFMTDLDSNLKLNKIYELNYERNRNLIIFERIPKEYKDIIVEAYNSCIVNFDINAIKKYLDNNKLAELSININDYNYQSSSSGKIQNIGIDLDWFN